MTTISTTSSAKNNPCTNLSSSTGNSISNLTLGNNSTTATWTAFPNSASSTSISGTNLYTNNYMYADLFNTSGLEELTLKSLLACLPEEKIGEIMDIAKENAADLDIFKGIIRSVVSYRHFSEDFLLKYIDYLDKDILFLKHRENICSREYHSLALLLEERDR